MSNKIGSFEILSEISSSPNGCVYKAADSDSNQTVALKTLKLEALGGQAESVVKSVLEEAEVSKSLNSPNIALLYGAGEIESLLCASMEYVQGNSIATMLSRKEGFSIWDLMDIARQTCQGLDHALVHKVVHYSLEPSKVMVQWDGTVKILSFGTSMMGAHAAQSHGAAPEVLHYMSPEQLRGDPLDSRSNFFSLAAILYEMVTERKAFEGDDADQVRQSILERTPVAPDRINRKIHPALSEVIMKALSKDPEQRYASGQDLVNDLERCKESSTKSAAKKAAGVPQGIASPGKVAAPVQSAKPKEVAPVAGPPKAAEKTSQPITPKAGPTWKPAEPVAAQKTDTSEPEGVAVSPVQAQPQKSAPERKAAAAAAGWGGASTTTSVPRAFKSDLSAQSSDSVAAISSQAFAREEGLMSSAATEPPIEAPAINVDPAMAESNTPSAPSGRSFSEIDELPPLKEAYVAPPPAPPADPEPLPEVQQVVLNKTAPEKPKVQPREVARKAVTEIKKTPPKMFMYSVAAAIAVVLLIIVAIAFHIHSENSDDDVAPVQTAQTSQAQPTPAPVVAAQPQPNATAPAEATPVQATPAELIPAEPADVSVRPKYSPKQKKAKSSAASAPVVVPGQLTVNSTPEGAQIAVDGRNDPTWVTPFNVTGLTPGQHSISVTKAGFGAETRTIEVGSGSKSFLVVQLAQLSAGLSVITDPAGAQIYLDGKDTGRVTPTQLSVEKSGNHTIVVKKQGYLDETTTANLQPGQTFHYAPTLRPLGSTDEIKTVSKFKKVFGGGDASSMGVVSIKTNPKGAQIAVNRRVLDKASPVDFYLNPGTYVIDITMSGFQPIQKVVNVDKGGKVAIDEVLQRQ